MTSEILEAIIEYWKDDEDTIVNCLMYLKQVCNHKYMIQEIENALDSMDRCIHCGEKLEMYEVRETHYELEGHYVETLSEALCPNCDK